MKRMRIIVVLIVLKIHLMMCLTITGQVCTGNKGVNIFTDGDFGSGISPVLQVNPNIAPGYIYTTQLPDDGFYSITNNTGYWNLYPTWLSIQDNSIDPNGYMMVVNASHLPGIFYEKTISDICGNTLYEFSADVINLIRSGTPNHGDPVIDFLIDGVVRFSTGRVPKTENWITYGFTFTAPENATSVKLTLRNNAPGGNGNDLALDNISFRACGPAAFIGIDPQKAIVLCNDDDPFLINAEISESANQKIFWQTSIDNINWTEYGVTNAKSITHDKFDVGTYYYRYISAGDDISILNEKCRIISDVVTIKVLPLEYYSTDTICSNQTYKFGNQIINTSGNYEETLTSSRGCDSIVYLTLNVIDSDIDYTRYDEICNYGIDILSANFDGEYFITINGGPTINVNAFPYRLPLEEDTNNVIYIESDIGCTHSLNVFIPDQGEVKATLDTTFLSTNIYQLSITSDEKITNIKWIPEANLDCASCLTPKIKILKDTEIKADLIFENGCKESISTFLKFKEVPKFIFANIFSPNGDGINDVFYISYPDDNITIKDFQIYDRWGSLVFSNSMSQSNNISSGWDGTFNGKDVGIGVYQFIGSAEDIIGNSLGRFSGTITLVR